MLNKSKLAIVLLSAGIFAGSAIALSPARTVLSKNNSAANGHKAAVVTLAAVQEALVIEQPTMVIAPADEIESRAGYFVGAGDNSAGVWVPAKTSK